MKVKGEKRKDNNILNILNSIFHFPKKKASQILTN